MKSWEKTRNEYEHYTQAAKKVAEPSERPALERGLALAKNIYVSELWHAFYETHIKWPEPLSARELELRYEERRARGMAADSKKSAASPTPVTRTPPIQTSTTATVIDFREIYSRRRALATGRGYAA